MLTRNLLVACRCHAWQPYLGFLFLQDRKHPTVSGLFPDTSTGRADGPGVGRAGILVAAALSRTVSRRGSRTILSLISRPDVPPDK